MKKTLFMLAVTGLALTSCSQEDVVYVNHRNDDAITFRARMNRPTKAQDFTTENLDSFKVYGYLGDINEIETEGPLTDYFKKAVEFKRDMTDNDNLSMYFTSDETYYWPNDGSWFSFLAYAPSDLTGVSSNTNGELHFSNFEVNPDIEKQIDLIAEAGAGAKDPELDGWDELFLYFKHALTKVYVSAAKNSNPEFDIEVAGVKISNIAMKGDCVFNGLSREDDEIHFDWTPSSELGEVVYIFDNPVKIEEDSTPLMDRDAANGSFLLIPQQLLNDRKFTEDSNMIAFNFKEGVAYISLLVRVVHTGSNAVMYPFKEGVEDITETVDGKQYAWASFPVGSLWSAQRYVEYVVDFSRGLGYVAPGAREDLEYTTILGPEIRFTEEVAEWSEGLYSDVGESHVVDVDQRDVEDPFGE
ncbi:MAG: fimbrillin family protein [Muribaculaceae bacterium]|nr:fimbrillin family protein [Muribaculaceae bacterium]